MPRLALKWDGANDSSFTNFYLCVKNPANINDVKTYFSKVLIAADNSAQIYSGRRDRISPKITFNLNFINIYQAQIDQIKSCWDHVHSSKVNPWFKMYLDAGDTTPYECIFMNLFWPAIPSSYTIGTADLMYNLNLFTMEK